MPFFFRPKKTKNSKPVGESSVYLWIARQSRPPRTIIKYSSVKMSPFRHWRRDTRGKSACRVRRSTNSSTKRSTGLPRPVSIFATLPQFYVSCHIRPLDRYRYFNDIDIVRDSNRTRRCWACVVSFFASVNAHRQNYNEQKTEANICST